MATAETIDIDEFLWDIPGDNPCGTSLRWEPVFDEAKACRPKGDKDPLVELEDDGDFPRLIELCTDVLKNQSKDLNFAAWLTEALTHTHGFAGLRDGLRLIARLLEKYWDGIFPEIDEDDLEFRVAPLVWLTEDGTGAKTPNNLRELPITPQDSNYLSYSYNYWASRNTTPIGENEDEDAFEQRRQEAQERASRFDEATVLGNAEFFGSIFEDIESCEEAIAEFSSIADEKFGFVAPGTTALKKALEDVKALVRRIADDKGYFAVAAVEEETSESDDSSESDGGGSSGGGGGPIRTRQDAHNRLQEVATYLKTTDPHSPVSYLVQRAVSWSYMSLEQLLKELIKDDTALSSIKETLGMSSEQEASSDDDW